MSKICESRDYGKFELMPINRDIYSTRYLEESMKEHGFLDAYPIHCIKNGSGKLLIKSGHHRFVVARKLGIPVKFVISNDTASIHQLEKTSKKWNLRDYLISYYRAGYPDYKFVNDFQERTEIPLYACISMLGGETAGSHNLTRKFISGRFEVKSVDHAEKVAELVKISKSVAFPQYNTQNFVAALSKLVWVAEMDFKQLKNKIKAHYELLRRQPTTADYITMLDMIYNRNCSYKVPLSFLAEDYARQRNAVKK